MTKFQSRHYEAVAAVLLACKERAVREAPSNAASDQRLRGVKLVEAELVDLFKADNPRFKEARFARATGAA